MICCFKKKCFQTSFVWFWYLTENPAASRSMTSAAYLFCLNECALSMLLSHGTDSSKIEMCDFSSLIITRSGRLEVVIICGGIVFPPPAPQDRSIVLNRVVNCPWHNWLSTLSSCHVWKYSAPVLVRHYTMIKYGAMFVSQLHYRPYKCRLFFSHNLFKLSADGSVLRPEFTANFTTPRGRPQRYDFHVILESSSILFATARYFCCTWLYKYMISYMLKLPIN